MKTKTLTLVALTGLLLTACIIPSVNPFYMTKDIVFEPGLIGEWVDEDSSEEQERWKFERDNENHYALTITEGGGKQGSFQATLFKLKDHQFLDLIPTECEYATDQADLVAISMFPGHLIIHIAQIEPELKMAFCDFDWLEKHLETNPRALPHREENDQKLLTGSTRQLQRFLLKHVEGGELFSDYGELMKEAKPEQ